ncbi:MAG: hypothetical protein KH333_11010 [Clostridium sp.]|nr:hypothetical protein [Clostridium sp.]
MDMYQVFKKLKKLEEENKILKEQLHVISKDRDFLLNETIDLNYFVSDLQELLKKNNINYNNIININSNINN